MALGSGFPGGVEVRMWCARPDLSARLHWAAPAGQEFTVRAALESGDGVVVVGRAARAEVAHGVTNQPVAVRADANGELNAEVRCASTSSVRVFVIRNTPPASSGARP